MPTWSDQATILDVKLEVNWSGNGSTWVDESQYLQSASGEQTMLPLWQQFAGTSDQPPWHCTMVLNDAEGRFDALYASSAHYANIGTNKAHGVPIRLEVGLWDDVSAYDYERIFTGYIDNLTPDSLANGTVTAVCIDNAHPLLEHRGITTMQTDQRTDTWLNTIRAQGGVTSYSLDSGLQTIPFVWMDDERLWSELNEAARGEGGRVYFDPDGQLVFENAESWARDSVHTTVQHTFTDARYSDIGTPFDQVNVYNQALVVASPRVRPGAFIQVYELDQPFVLAAGESRTFTARYDEYPSVSIAALRDNTDVVAVSGGADMIDDITVSVTAYAAQAEIQVDNDHATLPIEILRLNLFGDALLGGPSIKEPASASDSAIGNPATGTKKMFTAPLNALVQTSSQANFLQDIILAHVKTGRQGFFVSDVPAIPTLEPGHRVGVTHPRSGSHEGFITQIAWRLEGGGNSLYRADYTVIDADAWLPYDNYFVIGTSLFADSPAKRMFY